MTKIIGVLRVDPIRQQLKFEVIASANESWATAQANTANESLNELKEKSHQYSETLASIIDFVTVKAVDASLAVELTIPASIMNQLGEMMTEVMANLFSVSGNQQTHTGEDEIDHSLWSYDQQSSMAKPVNYTSDQDEALYGYVDGAVAINIESATLQNERLTLSLNTKLQLPKVEDIHGIKGVTGQLAVLSVTDQGGNELLRDERCIDVEPRHLTKNHQPSTQFNINNNIIQLQKRLRLIAGTRFNTVDKVKLTVGFSLVTDVSLLEIPAVPGKVIDQQGVRLFIGKVDNGDVSYQLSGDVDSVIEVRGLNKDKKSLKKSGRFSMGNNVTQSYRGQVKYLQLVVINSKETINRHYTLSMDQLAKIKKPDDPISMPLTPTVFSMASQQQLKVFQPDQLKEPQNSYYWKERRKHLVGETLSGPLKIELSHDWKSRWSYEPDIYITYPMIDGIYPNFNGIEVQINQATAQPLILTGTPSINYGFNKRDGFKPYYRYLMNQTPYSRIRIDLDNYPIESEGKIDTLSGSVNLLLPTAIKKNSVQFPDLGDQVSFSRSDISLKKIKFGSFSKYEFEITGEQREVLHVVAQTNNHALITPNQNYLREGKRILVFDPRDDYALLDIYTAKDTKKVRYPFSITPAYH